MVPSRGPQPDHVHFEDAKQFLALYDLLASPTRPLPPSGRRNLRQVIDDHGAALQDKYTTLLGRLTRVFDYFWPGRPAHQGSGVSELFREDAPGQGVRPTRKADVLYRHLKTLVDVHDRLRPAVVTDLGEAPARPVIRIGAPHSIALRILSAAFSGWQDVFGGVELDLRIANSTEVMARLNASLLDLVVSYGPVRPVSIEQTGEARVRYVPLRRAGDPNGPPAYLSRLVLIAHPRARVALKGGGDANDGYWDSPTYRDPAAGPRSARQGLQIPGYDDLRPLDLSAVDTAEVPFVWVTTFNPPPPVLDLLERLRRPDHTVDWHEEALALVRSGLAVSVVSEGTARRRGVTAFRLVDKKGSSASFTRAIGLYTPDGSTADRPEVRSLVAYLEQFLTRFESDVRDIKAPRYGDDKLMRFLKKFREDGAGQS